MAEPHGPARHDLGQLDFQQEQLLRYLTRQGVELRLWASDLVLEAVYGWHDCTDPGCVSVVGHDPDAVRLVISRLHEHLAGEAEAGVDPWHLMHRADRAALLGRLRHGGRPKRAH
jgi:hypothetical protein